MPYPVAIDVEGKVVRAFDGVPYVPMAFILDANGKIAYQQAGKLDIAKSAPYHRARTAEEITPMLWIKALHLIFMVTWFAGLFYLPRLFVYHAMVEDAAGRERFKVMERKLFYGIMTPGGVLTIVFGTWLWLGYDITGHGCMPSLSSWPCSSPIISIAANCLPTSSTIATATATCGTAGSTSSRC